MGQTLLLGWLTFLRGSPLITTQGPCAPWAMNTDKLDFGDAILPAVVSQTHFSLENRSNSAEPVSGQTVGECHFLNAIHLVFGEPGPHPPVEGSLTLASTRSPSGPGLNQGRFNPFNSCHLVPKLQSPTQLLDLGSKTFPRSLWGLGPWQD